MHRLRAQPIGDDDLHLPRFRRQPSAALRGKPGPRSGEPRWASLLARFGRNDAEGGDPLQLVDAQFRVDRLPANSLIHADLARHSVGGARPGVVRPYRAGVAAMRSANSASDSQNCRGSPQRGPRKTFPEASREDAARQSPFQELWRRPAGMHFAQRLIVMAAGVEIGEHAIGVEPDIHEIIGARGGQQLRGDLLAFQRDVGMEREAWGHPHRQPEQLAHEMILEIGEHHLDAVEMRFWADEAGHVVDHERVEIAGPGRNRAPRSSPCRCRCACRR